MTSRWKLYHHKNGDREKMVMNVGPTSITDGHNKRTIKLKEIRGIHLGKASKAVQADDCPHNVCFRIIHRKETGLKAHAFEARSKEDRVQLITQIIDNMQLLGIYPQNGYGESKSQVLTSMCQDKMLKIMFPNQTTDDRKSDSSMSIDECQHQMESERINELKCASTHKKDSKINKDQIANEKHACEALCRRKEESLTEIKELRDRSGKMDRKLIRKNQMIRELKNALTQAQLIAQMERASFDLKSQMKGIGKACNDEQLLRETSSPEADCNCSGQQVSEPQDTPKVFECKPMCTETDTARARQPEISKKGEHASMAEEDPSHDYSGYLWKRSSTNNKKWTKRWFDLRNGELQYFESETKATEYFLNAADDCKVDHSRRRQYVGKAIEWRIQEERIDNRLYIRLVKDAKKSCLLGSENGIEHEKWCKALQHAKSRKAQNCQKVTKTLTTTLRTIEQTLRTIEESEKAECRQIPELDDKRKLKSKRNPKRERPVLYDMADSLYCWDTKTHTLDVDKCVFHPIVRNWECANGSRTDDGMVNMWTLTLVNQRDSHPVVIKLVEDALIMCSPEVELGVVLKIQKIHCIYAGKMTENTRRKIAEGHETYFSIIAQEVKNVSLVYDFKATDVFQRRRIICCVLQQLVKNGKMTQEMLQKQYSALSTMDQERIYAINIGECEITRSPIRFQEPSICSNDVITPLDRLPHRRQQAVPQARDVQASQPISKHFNEESVYKLLKQWKNEEFNKRSDRGMNCHSNDSMQKLLSVGTVSPPRSISTYPVHHGVHTVHPTRPTLSTGSSVAEYQNIQKRIAEWRKTDPSEFETNSFLNKQSQLSHHSHAPADCSHYTNVNMKSITDYDDIHKKFEKWNTYHSELEIQDHRAHYDAKNVMDSHHMLSIDGIQQKQAEEWMVDDYSIHFQQGLGQTAHDSQFIANHDYIQFTNHSAMKNYRFSEMNSISDYNDIHKKLVEWKESDLSDTKYQISSIDNEWIGGDHGNCMNVGVHSMESSNGNKPSELFEELLSNLTTTKPKCHNPICY